MLLDYYSTLKEIRSFLGASGYQLQYRDGVPCTDGTTIYVEKPRPEWSKEEITVWKGTLHHEIGHNDEDMRDVFDLLARLKLPSGSIYNTVINIVDDYRQERHKLGMYIGRDAVLSKSNQIVIDKIINRRKPNTGTGKLDDSEIADCIQNWSILAREDWQGDLIGRGGQWRKTTRREQQEKTDVLFKEYTDRLNSITTADEEWELIEDILKNVFDIDTDERIKQEQEAFDEKDSCTEGSEGKEGDRVGRPKGRVKYEDILTHDHEKRGRPALGSPYSKAEDVDTYYDDGRDFPIDPSPTIQDYEKGFSESLSGDSHFVRTTSEALASIESGANIAKAVRKLLQAKMKTVTIHGQKKGKLSGKNVFRAGLRGTGEYQRKVFKKKEENLSTDAAITVLIDYSGSMRIYDKIAHAIKAATLLNEVVKVVGSPMEILGFTDRDCATHQIYKSFNRPVSTEKLVDRMLQGVRYLANNADGEAILWAYSRLARQKQKKKVLIVLSDGWPETPRGDATVLTKKVVKQIEKEKIVDIYGIGILDKSVKNYYTQHSVINDASELEGALINLVKTKLIN